MAEGKVILSQLAGGVIGALLQHPSQLFFCLSDVVHVEVVGSAVDVGEEEVGVGLDGTLNVGQGLFVLAQHAVGTGAAAIGLGVVGIELDGAVEVGDGLGVVALIIAEIAAVVVALGKIGFEPDGLLEVGQGLLSVALGIVGHATVEIGLGVARGEAEGLGVETHLLGGVVAPIGIVKETFGLHFGPLLGTKKDIADDEL